MKKLLFTVSYFPDESQLSRDDTHPWDPDKLPKDVKSLRQMKAFYDVLVDCKKQYAQSIGANFAVIEPSQITLDGLQQVLPGNDIYQQLNFYKLFLLEEFAKQYDQVCYMDLDVVPMSKENIFEHFPEFGIKWQPAHMLEVRNFARHTVPRAVEQKFRDMFRVSMELGDDIEGPLLDNGVINTGIIVGSSENINKLRFVDDIMEYVTTAIFVKSIPNNEVFFTRQLLKSGIQYKSMDDRWHFIYDNITPLSACPLDVHMIHVICKRFNKVL